MSRTCMRLFLLAVFAPLSIAADAAEDKRGSLFKSMGARAPAVRG